MRMLRRLLSSEKGAAAIEYGVALAVLAVLIAGGLRVAGERIGLSLDTISNG